MDRASVRWARPPPSPSPSPRRWRAASAQSRRASFFRPRVAPGREPRRSSRGRSERATARGGLTCAAPSLGPGGASLGTSSPVPLVRGANPAAVRVDRDGDPVGHGDQGDRRQRLSRSAGRDVRVRRLAGDDPARSPQPAATATPDQGRPLPALAVRPRFLRAMDRTATTVPERRAPTVCCCNSQ